MKLKFKEQDYQNDAVGAIVSCFEGEKKETIKNLIARYTEVIDKGTLLEKTEEVEQVSFGNHKISLTESERRNNIRKVQRLNDINYTDDQNLNDFSIEMETGTGKTYTYIKTMYELNKAYGWSKFIVMVPTIAIREGVQKTFEITEDHFQELYQKKIRYFVYNSQNSANIANINTFASNNSIQVMIINYQAFAAKGSSNRRIYEELDELQSRKPIDVIKSVHPILIIDEPQKFGDKTESLFQEFNPLFTIRYSATHKKGKEYNKVYRLDAIDAFNQKLVKKINVKGIEVLNGHTDGAYFFLESVNISQKHDPEAIMEIEVRTKNGTTKKRVKLKSGDDLYVKSGNLTTYKGYVVSDIDGRYDQYDKVFFSNGFEISVGQAYGEIDEEHIIRIQIRETIESHLEKERELYKDNIKVLSLFFIDEVAKYKYYEDGKALKGKYAKIFEEEYQAALLNYRTIIDEEYVKYLDSFEPREVHAGYFSIDKKGHEVDSVINDKKEYLSFDENAYDLIMKDKERLLSFEEPVRFIFSHSALREGWDNPNIFQICTLKNSKSEISKRQEIGRGLRICVNQDGERMDYKELESDFHRVNSLTVVASESYDSFSRNLQEEISISLSERPKNFAPEVFIDKVLINENGDKLIIDSNLYNKLLNYNANNGYIDLDNNSKLTDKFIKDMENDSLNILEELKPYYKAFSDLMKKIYSTDHTKIVNDERRENIKTLSPNANFMKKEFQELWKKINHKTVYEVSFDSLELIDKAVNAINQKLLINQTRVKITEGSQQATLSVESLKAKESMKETKTKTEIINLYGISDVKYDLIGELTNKTGLTRKTIIKILTNISPQKFEMFKYSPEEFISKVTKYINEEKATTVIEGITYHKTNQKYENDIFTINNIRGELGENAVDVKKHIYDFLITDSKTEIEFAKKLETGEVKVYAKLPSGFKIPTPVGNYNPDWAIVLDNPSFKYVYFVAETKGSMDSMEHRGIEESKIACARKHFESLKEENIQYEVVDGYESLINMLTS